MSTNPNNLTHERHQSLWLLAWSPLIWATHFLLCYLTAAIWIEKTAGRDHSLDPVRVAIAIYTVVALAGIGLVFRIGYRKHHHGESKLPHDWDTPEDRHRFLGFATILLSGLSALATLFVALTAAFIKTTH